MRGKLPIHPAGAANGSAADGTGSGAFRGTESAPAGGTSGAADRTGALQAPSTAPGGLR